MNKKQKGFTLIELITVISVLALLVITGMTVFYRSLRGSSRIEVQKNLEIETQHVISSMSRLIREGEIVSVNGNDRDVCFQSGSLSGTVLVVEDSHGHSTTYSLSGGRISSGSAFLNTEGVEVTDFLFVWSCGGGSFDNLNISFAASALGDDGSRGPSDEYSFDLLIRNSSY